MAKSNLLLNGYFLEDFTFRVVGATKPNCPFFPFVHMHGPLTMGAHRAVIHLPPCASETELAVTGQAEVALQSPNRMPVAVVCIGTAVWAGN